MSAPDKVLGRKFPIIALVCSTGGLAALTTVLASLPADLPAAVVALQHVSPHRRSLLPEILRRCTAMPVRRVHDGDALIPGQVLVAPEAVHLVVCPDGCVRLIPSDGAPRPSADLLLCTLAVAMGSRAIAVVLTGAGQDGATGAVAIDMLGGVTLVEDPSTAQSSGMPEAARCRIPPAVTLPLSAIGPALQDLVHRSRGDDGTRASAKPA